MKRQERIDVLLATLARIRRTPGQDEVLRTTVITSPEDAAQPLVVRRAKALALLLRTCPVAIYPEELIVGLPLREAAVGPDERAGAERAGELDRLLPPGGTPGLQYIVEAKRQLAQGSPATAYSPNLTAPISSGGDFRYGLLPRYATEAELREAARFGLADNSNPGHLQAGHARVIRYGWSGLRGMAERRLAVIDRASAGGQRAAAFLEAVIITLDGARDLALRYADLADRMAVAAEGGEAARRGRELTEIAAICRRVAIASPETWREALQLHWLTHIIAACQGARQLGRFDQYMYPLLAADLTAGRLDEEQATELLECLWVKYNQVTAITEDNLQNMILGGQTPDGEDATNELTLMCIDTSWRRGLVDPKLSVRLHRDSPAALLTRTASLIAGGRHQPGLYNDEAIVPSISGTGVPLHHARDYTNDGCSELLVQARTNPWCFEAKVQLLRCLERVAMHLPEYDSFEGLWRALCDEVSVAADMAISNANLLQAAVPRISPNPFVSATIEGCIERGVDLTEGGALYNPAALCASGVADTADALAAMRDLIFESKQVSAGDMRDALAEDFAGREPLRLRLLNRVPKFGNNDDRVDALAVALVEHLAQCVRGRRNPRGGKYVLGLFSYGDYIAHGMLTGATPDGRRAGTGISPNFSPAPGRDIEGPYAVLQSTAKVHPSLTPNGRAVDITLHPSAVAGPNGEENLVCLIRAFVASGEMQVQFNVADGRLLRAAQLNPERHRNLTVRIWGFPAHFVSLPREFQDHLIARTGYSPME